MKTSLTLAELPIGLKAVILSIHTHCSISIKKKLLALGFIKSSTVKVIRIAPLGSPIEVELMGARFSLRKSEAENIFVSLPEQQELLV